jgi:hypothetical protein
VEEAVLGLAAAGMIAETVVEATNNATGCDSNNHEKNPRKIARIFMIYPNDRSKKNRVISRQPCQIRKTFSQQA